MKGDKMLRLDPRKTALVLRAFHGTDLDDHLRRRGIETIVLAGIATNIGVELTARQGFERNYALVVANASTGLSAEMHQFSMMRRD